MNSLCSDPDAQAIAAVIAAREAAWNGGDAAAYAELLTEDADIMSGTGRPARGRDALLRLYAEQRAGPYAGVRTRTRVLQVRRMGEHTALADVGYELEGGDTALARTGFIVFVLRRESGRWKIAAIRGVPGRAAAGGLQER